MERKELDPAVEDGLIEAYEGRETLLQTIADLQCSISETMRLISEAVNP